MNRRALLKLLALGVAGHTLDIDKLLYVPGEKTFFLPSPVQKGLTASQIIEVELRHILPKLQLLFDRDDEFYRRLRACNIEGRMDNKRGSSGRDS